MPTYVDAILNSCLSIHFAPMDIDKRGTESSNDDVREFPN